MLIRCTDIPELCIYIQIRFDRSCFFIPSDEFIIRRIRFCCIRGCLTRVFCRSTIGNIALCLDTLGSYIKTNSECPDACCKCRVYIPVFNDMQKRRRITLSADYQRPSNKGIGFRFRRRLRRCASAVGNRSTVCSRRCTENRCPIIIVEIANAADILIADIDIRIFFPERLHGRSSH